MRASFTPIISAVAVRAPEPAAGKWNLELILRYVAATATTWIAMAGAQLYIPTHIVLMLALLALAGVPVSLYLRATGMRVGKIPLSPRLWNAVTVIGSAIVGALILMPTISDMVLIWSSEPANFWLRFGGGDSLAVLMQAFLVFAAFRSFAIISDKDATLTTIPSFSVLLLLIPVHKGIEVVCYFLAWTFVATILFALDHRSELRAGVVGRVPAPIPGQDVRLAARSLLSVLGVSLVAAIGISMYLTSRNPEERSEAETAITALASRLTQFALSLPDGSVNSGPERQIDYSSGPNLPSQAELWRASVVSVYRRPLRPEYWRLFSLSNYDGKSWSQILGRQASLKRTRVESIPREYFFPLPPTDTLVGNSSNAPRGEGSGGGRVESPPGLGGLFNPGGGPGMGGSPGTGADNAGQTRDSLPVAPGAAPRQDGPTFGPFPPFFGFTPPTPATKPVPGYPGIFSRQDDGFAVGSVSKSAHQYGSPSLLARISVRAQNANLGYIPMLPNVDTMGIRFGEQNEARVTYDGAVDLGVMQPGERAYFTGNIPRLTVYGFRSGEPPVRKVPASKSAPKLSRQDRTINLKLPSTVTKRTRNFAKSALQGVTKNESNYSRAQRLARAIQEDAVYTLRPPSVPDGRDATDFFLFDGSRRGYCTYFAGALTVLCRAQNIPARVVSGFASPDYDNDGWAIIRDANAHAWTEIWIENWGWAVVDATPADDRGDNAPTWIESWSDWCGAMVDSLTRNVRAQWPLLAVSGVGLALLVVRWRRRRLGSLIRRGALPLEVQRREIVMQYERMSHLLARRFRPRATWETPDEWLRAAETALPHLPLDDLREVTRLFLQAQFSPRPLAANAPGAAKAAVERARQFDWRGKVAAPA